MFASQDGFRSRYQYNRLCVVNNHRGPLNCISNIEGVEEEDRCVCDAADLAEIHAVCRVYLLAVHGSLLNFGDFGEDGLSEAVERLADASDLRA